MAKLSMSDLRTRASTVDRAKLDATTDAQIETYKGEDGYADLPIPETVSTVEPPRALRVRLGMTQREMADALHIPLGTWRNWEQGRVALEPAALALLAIVSRIPDRALAALSPAAEAPTASPAPIESEDEAIRALRRDGWDIMAGSNRVHLTRRPGAGRDPEETLREIIFEGALAEGFRAAVKEVG